MNLMSASDRLRQTMELALAEEPDDLASHMAYADLLTEQDDPRGDFIRVQLALEDESRSPAERSQLRSRERELLEAHEREWLGELAPLLLGTPAEQRELFVAELASESPDLDEDSYPGRGLYFRHGWARGWLDSLECSCLTVEMARKLGRAPIARLLRAFVYRSVFFGYIGQGSLFRYEDGPDLPGEASTRFYPVEVLAHYPAIRNVRVFQYGSGVDPEEDMYNDGTKFNRLAPLVERMPRLAELSIFAHVPGWGESDDLERLVTLPTLTNLRVLRCYHGLVYPLERLAANPALTSLTHLLCFPHSFACEWDQATQRHNGTEISRDSARAVVVSPHLASLTHLQLRCCDGGDGLIDDIVASGTLKRLKMLDLRHGHVTDAGARLLAGCPDARNLEVLDLINNRLTQQGIAALEAAGLPLRADRQQGHPFDDEHILDYGDSE